MTVIWIFLFFLILNILFREWKLAFLCLVALFLALMFTPVATASKGTLVFLCFLGVFVLLVVAMIYFQKGDREAEKKYQEYLQEKTEREVADLKYKEYVEKGRKQAMKWKKNRTKK